MTTSTRLGRHRTALRLTAASAAVLSLSTGCSTGEPPVADAGAPAAHVVFLGESGSLRYVASDGPWFQSAVLNQCPDCVVESQFAASQDEQNTQAQQAIDDGADVLVVAPLDSALSAPIGLAADAAGVSLISYDSLITNAPIDLYMTFDSGQVGAIGAQAVVGGMEEGAVVVELDGDPGNANAAWIAEGARAVIPPTVDVLRYDVTGWSGDLAEELMTQALDDLDGRPLAGVIGANDSIAGGAAAALREAGYTGDLPPISGQDAQVAALQRLLTGDQKVTAYKSMPQLAAAAAAAALQLAAGTAPDADDSRDNGHGQVPTVLLQPVAVTRDTIATTVLADGFTTADALCSGSASASCTAAGIER